MSAGEDSAMSRSSQKGHFYVASYEDLTFGPYQFLPYYSCGFDDDVSIFGLEFCQRSSHRQQQPRYRKRDQIRAVAKQTFSAACFVLTFLLFLRPKNFYLLGKSGGEWLTALVRLIVTSSLLAHCAYSNEEVRRVCFQHNLGCYRASHSHHNGPTGAASNLKLFFTEFDVHDDGSSSLRTGKAYGLADSLTNAPFNSSLATRVIIHGFKSSSEADWALPMAKALHGMEKSNVLLFDWRAGAKLHVYSKVCENVYVAASGLALMLRNLVQTQSLDLKRTHLIGHSLGAHLSGFVGTNIQLGIAPGQITDQNGQMPLLQPMDSLYRITGLDPANVLFDTREAGLRLSPEDADFVDIIHTDAAPDQLDGFGTEKPLGHADFYPNGGSKQPGCDAKKAFNTLWSAFDVFTGRKSRAQISCNHKRCTDYFTASVEGETRRRRSLGITRDDIVPIVPDTEAIASSNSHESKRSVRMGELADETHQAFAGGLGVADSCAFQAYPCTSWEDFISGRCHTCGSLDPEGKPCPVMGINAVRPPLSHRHRRSVDSDDLTYDALESTTAGSLAVNAQDVEAEMELAAAPRSDSGPPSDRNDLTSSSSIHLRSDFSKQHRSEPPPTPASGSSNMGTIPNLVRSAMHRADAAVRSKATDAVWRSTTVVSSNSVTSAPQQSDLDDLRMNRIAADNSELAVLRSETYDDFEAQLALDKSIPTVSAAPFAQSSAPRPIFSLDADYPFKLYLVTSGSEPFCVPNGLPEQLPDWAKNVIEANRLAALARQTTQMPPAAPTRSHSESDGGKAATNKPGEAQEKDHIAVKRGLIVVICVAAASLIALVILVLVIRRLRERSRRQRGGGGGMISSSDVKLGIEGARGTFNKTESTVGLVMMVGSEPSLSSSSGDSTSVGGASSSSSGQASPMFNLASSPIGASASGDQQSPHQEDAEADDELRSPKTPSPLKRFWERLHRSDAEDEASRIARVAGIRRNTSSRLPLLLRNGSSVFFNGGGGEDNHVA